MANTFDAYHILSNPIELDRLKLFFSDGGGDAIFH